MTVAMRIDPERRTLPAARAPLRSVWISTLSAWIDDSFDELLEALALFFC